MRVHLHGPFAAFHPGPIEIVASTAWEAIEAVVSQLKGFQPDPIRGRKRIQAIGFPSIESLKSQAGVKDLHLIPALTFGKKSGLLTTIIGVALVVVSVALPGAALFTGFSGVLFGIGASMAIGGIMQMLSPAPTLSANTDEDAVKSKYLSSQQNTVKIGTTIPLLYGRYNCGGHIMSMNIDAKDTGV